MPRHIVHGFSNRFKSGLVEHGEWSIVASEKKLGRRAGERRSIQIACHRQTFLCAAIYMFVSLVGLDCLADTKPNSLGVEKPLTLVVEFKGLRNTQGKIMACLFTSEKGFPKDAGAAIKVVSVTLQPGVVPRVEFSGLSPGSYAVSALHDENENQKLETNWIGIPLEGVAASRDAKGNMAAPSYEDAVLEVTQDRKIEVTFDYW